METPINVEECKINRDSFARALYDKMFTWIVQSLNMHILPSDMSQSDCYSLGLLDIFGFENFEINSFEQFCINYTNEKLQQLYIVYVFKAEEEEFKKEGLKQSNTNLSYQDNQQIIDVMDKYPIGIFDLLDESCSLGNSSDEKLYQKIVSTHAKNENMKIPKIQNMKFSIIHTAKEVEYTIDGFRNKNKDEISSFLDACINSSMNAEITYIWQGISEGQQEQVDTNGRQSLEASQLLRSTTLGKTENRPNLTSAAGKNQKFLGAKFRAQMKDLMGELNQCDVHFIRCIKPNEEKIKDRFYSQFVLQQIRYLGILESIKVRREGFPCRLSYQEFYTKYHELDVFNRKIPLQRHLDMKQDMQGLCKELLFRVVKDINKKEVLFGETKIYLKVQPASELDMRLIKWWQYKNNIVTKIQNQWEVHTFRKVVKENLKLIKKKISAFTKLQATYKMKKARQAYLQTLNVKKGIDIVQKVMKKAQQSQLKEVLQKWADKLKMEKKGVQWKNAITKICSINKKNDLQDIKEYWERWKNFLKEYKENNKNVIEDQEEQVIAKVEEQKVEQDLKQQVSNDEVDEEEEEKKDEVKELKQVIDKKPVSQKIIFIIKKKKRADPNRIQMENDDVQSDEFSSKGLKIWPNLTNFTKPQNLKDKNSIPEDIVNNPQNYKNENEPEQKDNLNQIFSDQFILKVQQNSFLEYCDKNVKRAKNFSKKMEIGKIMQYQSSNLNESLLQSADSSNLQATKIFRSILKIAGNRNSRFPPRYHSDMIINMCYGRDAEIDPSCYMIGGKTKVENPEDQKKDKSKKDQKSAYDSNQRKDSNLERYQSQAPKQVNHEDESDMSEQGNLTGRQQKFLKDEIQPLRDEAYFQICKQIAANKSAEARKNLLKFAAEMTNLFAPSEAALFPLINFFMDQAKNDQNQSNKDDAKYIVTKLSDFSRNYAVIKQKNPYQIQSAKIIKDDLVLKENDPLLEDMKKMESSKLFHKYMSKIEPRVLIPSNSETQKIHKRQNICFKVYLFNETHLWVPVESLETVKFCIEKACIQIDMKERSQFFSFYEVTFQDGKIIKEGFLKDNVKIMDVYNSHKISTELELKKHGKNIEFKIYLRIRIYYKLFKDDIDSINMFYMQNIFEVNQGRLPLTTNQITSLAAHYCYSVINNKTEDKNNSVENIITQAIPKYKLQSQTKEHWIEQVKTVYQKLKYDDVIESKWMYLEIIRPHDLFLSYQFECRMFVQEKTDQGYVLKSTQQVVFGIRPLQIIISDKDRITLNIIDFSQMMKWGSSLNNNSYFLIQHENNMLYIFEIQNTDLADYLINAYVNWKLNRNIDEPSNPTYNDVLTFLINPEEDKKNQIQ